MFFWGHYRATKTYKDEIEELKSENEQLAKALGKATIKSEWAVGKLKSFKADSYKGIKIART